MEHRSTSHSTPLSISKSQSSTKISDEVIANLGNLLLVPKDFNSEKLKNKPFLEKKKLLVQHGIPLDPVLEAAKTWDSKSIAKRQEVLF